MSKRNQRLKRERYCIRKYTGLTPREFRLREEDENPPCWCGEKNPHYSDHHEQTCGGSGVLNCLCGGDFCVCHNHGEMECFGCPDCESDDDYNDDDYAES